MFDSERGWTEMMGLRVQLLSETLFRGLPPEHIIHQRGFETGILLGRPDQQWRSEMLFTCPF